MIGERRLTAQWPQRDPEGKIRNIAGFSSAGTQCEGDAHLNPPLLIRPPIGSDASVREQLHRAADFAAGNESHYRFFAYSQANIAFDPPNNFSNLTFRAPDGEVPTVSTSFIWYSLKSAGINLEGDGLEGNDTPVGAAPPLGSKGIVDGLYYYSESERRRGAYQVYSSTFNRVREIQEDGAGPVADVVEAATIQARRIASQFANCFGSDECGIAGAFSDAFENPGPGIAISPDQFLFWDGPEHGGVFGDREPVQYRSADYRRVHHWAATAGTGSVSGSVALGTDGSPVQGALVTVAGLDTGSNGFGEFSFAGVPEGNYEIRAEKLVLRSNPLQDCPSDGIELCDHLVDVEPVSVAGDGSVSNVSLVLEPEAAIPPPTLSAYARRVDFTGTIIITDSDVGGNQFGEFRVDGSFCEVSPLERDVRVKLPDSLTCRDEVRAEVYANCSLQGDNETVAVTIDVELFEGTDCKNTDKDGEGHKGPISVPACVGDCTPSGTSLFVRNKDEGGDIVEAYLSFRNNQGTLLENLPNVQPENLRRVTFTGQVDILETDTFAADERGAFLFSQECLVDPFDRDDSFSYSQCVGGEVNFKVDVQCRLGLDNQSVDVNVQTRLFEGTTCLSKDLDGSQNREFLVSPCNGSCRPTPLLATVNNKDEGGDKGTIDIQILNEQR